MIRSLTLKLTLAFLFIGLVGSLIVALLTYVQTRQQFSEFILDLYQSEFVTDIVDYYEVNGTWEGIEDTPFMQPGSRFQGGPGRGPVTIVDTEGRVVIGPYVDRIIPTHEQQGRLPLKVDDEVIGWMMIYSPGGANSPEGNFLTQLNQNVVLSAVIATSLALIIGIVLARTISHPIRDLKTATLLVAAGNLGYQVPVRTRDELGQLALSFNQMSADLAQSNNLRRQMTADVAHELRNPLSIILGYTEALSEGKLRGDGEIFTVMHDEALHLQRLVDDLRTLSLADAGELSLLKLVVPPASLLERVAIAHRPHAQEKHVSLEVQAEPGLPDLSVDPDRIVQVLGNLVGNALRYTPPQGQITLTAKTHNEGVEIHVSDTGEGISTEDLVYVFERFYRADRSRFRSNGESGLGLAIARSIVEAHGGTISVSSALGRGTTFTILLSVKETSL